MKGYQIKVTIRGSKPPIWRRIIIPAEATFYQLHDTLQIAFGWAEHRVHSFQIPSMGIVISQNRNVYDNSEYVDDTLLVDVLEPTLRLIACDVINDQKHDILVEKEIETSLVYPQIMKWKGDCLFEDLTDFDTHELTNTQHPFDLTTCNDRLQTITIAYQEMMSEENDANLNQALLSVRAQLWDKEIHDLSLVILQMESQNIYIGFNRVQDDITLQIYDNEEAYIQGVDHVSSHSQGNLFADTICVILSKDSIPIKCWKTKDKKGMIKRMKPGFLPSDLNNDQAVYACMALQVFSEAIQHWNSSFPSYANNECLRAIKHKEWKLQAEPIRLHIQHPQQHMKQADLKKLEKLNHHGVWQVDLICVPGTQIRNGKMDVIFTLEEADTIYEDPFFDVDLQSFETINLSVMENLVGYALENGIPERLIVNNENMRVMVEGFCKDLHIVLSVESFVTSLEQEMMELFDSTDMQVLDTLADMSSEEFYEFISNMDEEEMNEFHGFLTNYLDLDNFKEMFPETTQKKKGNYFDA